MKKPYPLLIGICLLTIPNLVRSQKGILFADSSRRTLLPSAILFKEDSLPIPAQDRTKFFKSFLPLDARHELRLKAEQKDRDGFTHQIFEQYYKSVRVQGGQYVLHIKDSRVRSMNGNFQPMKDLSVTPSMTEKDALTFVLNDIKASKYMWQLPEEELLFQQATGVKDTSYFPRGSLIITPNDLSLEAASKLAYQFIVYAKNPFGKWLVYVDAHTGKVLYKVNIIETTNAPGTADTRYSGTQAIVTDTYPGGFRLRETRGANNVAIQTYNMVVAGNNYGLATDYSDNDNNWTAAEYHDVNNDDAALDAHWGTERVFDYWSQVQNRNSWNNSGGSLLGYVNADLTTMGFLNSDNAFWDGSKMTYGRGTNVQPLTSLDILAHEIGHGVCESSISGSIGYTGEAGALNESLSDIWAACVKAWATPGKPTWLLGSDVVPGGLRSMSNPKSLGQPNTYGGQFWQSTSGCIPSTLTNDKCFVHNNDGVQNFWFYLLSNGGSGTNDLGNAYSVPGVGINTAAAIVYKAETGNYLTNGMSYAQARTAYIQAASDLYGATSCQVLSVTNAWFAVGLGAPFTIPNASISGNPTVCGSVTYTVTNLPATATVAWDISVPNLVDMSCQNCTSTTLTSRGSGAGYLHASITYCGYTYVLQTSVSIGGPNISNLTAVRYMGSQCITASIRNNFVVTNPGGITSPVQIKSDNGAILYNSGSNTPVSIATTPMFGVVATNGSASLLISIQNSCGWSGWKSVIIPACTSGSFVVSPNPASSTITVGARTFNNKANEASTNSNASSFTAIQIVEKSGVVRRKMAYAAGVTNTSIRVADLPAGIYILRVLNGNTWESYEIVIVK